MSVSYITSVSLSLVLFCALSAECLSSQSVQPSLMTEVVSVYISDRGSVYTRSKDTGRFNQLPNAEEIRDQEGHISLRNLANIGLIFSQEDFEKSVPRQFKRFYMADEKGNFRLTIGGFLVSGGDCSFLSPERAAQEELQRERIEDKRQYIMPFIRCTSPVHLLKP